jgi:hypothetical protein
MSQEPFEPMLSGGHPNSLGRTEEVVAVVLADPPRLQELYGCYFSDDEVVRLRTSSTMKRVTKAQPALVVPYIDGLLTDIAAIDQASTQWTLAILFDLLRGDMTDEQRTAAEAILKHNLATHTDWIVLNTTMQVLADWAGNDAELTRWLLPHLERLAHDRRKSVANRAKKLARTFDAQDGQNAG